METGGNALSFDDLRKAGQIALREQRLDAARAAAAELQQRFPKRPAGLLLEAHVARDRADWAAALAGYDACLAQFERAVQPDWLFSRAWCLQKLGRAEAAEAVLRGLLADPAEKSRAAGLLADLYVQNGRAADAVALLDGIFAELEGPAGLSLLAARGQALDKLGRTAEADAVWREVVAHEPDHPSAAMRNLLALSRTQPVAALAAFRAGPLGRLDRYGGRMTAAWLAARCDDMDYLRDVLPPLIAEARWLQQCTKLVPLIAMAWEGWDRTAGWLALERQLTALAPGADPADRRTGELLAMRLKLALKDHAGFLALHDAAEPAGHASAAGSQGVASGVMEHKYDQVAQALRRRPFADFNAEKVFGIGLSKSGTTSLAAALDQLGFVTAHYINDFSFELLTPQDAFLYDALTDIPVCPYIEMLAETFPRARFIYTTREMQSWNDSFLNHGRRYDGTDDFAVMRQRIMTPGAVRHGSGAQFRVPLFYRHENAQAAREAYEARVFGYFAAERAHRLLVLDVSEADAWPTLCKFLDRPAQDGPFPHRNSRNTPVDHLEAH